MRSRVIWPSSDGCGSLFNTKTIQNQIYSQTVCSYLGISPLIFPTLLSLFVFIFSKYLSEDTRENSEYPQDNKWRQNQNLIRHWQSGKRKEYQRKCIHLFRSVNKAQTTEGVTTCYGLSGLGVSPDRTDVHPPSRTTGYLDSFSALQRPGCDVDNPPLSGAGHEYVSPLCLLAFTFTKLDTQK
jgi:hypothetical protein